MWGLFWEMDWWHMEGGVHNSCMNFFLCWIGQEETTKDILQVIWILARESDPDNPSYESEVSTTHLQHYCVNHSPTTLLMQNICEGLIKY
jgi:hypothetical protein